MKKIILSILAVLLVTVFLADDSQAGRHRGHHRSYRTGYAVAACPRPYRRHYYSPAPVVYMPPPAPVMYMPPAPAFYPVHPWTPGFNIFFPGVSIGIW